MTSTPLSTTSTRSTPHWRSLSKNTAQSSLSLVVAKPEAGAPLASAVQHLPMPSEADMRKRDRSESLSIATRKDATAIEEDPGPKRARTAAAVPAEATEAATQPTSGPDDGEQGANTSPVVSLNGPAQDILPNPSARIPESVSAQPPVASASSAPSLSLMPSTSSDSLATNRAQGSSSASWFSSLSRRRAKDTVRKSSKAAQMEERPVDEPAHASNLNSAPAVATTTSDAQSRASETPGLEPVIPALNIVPPTPPRTNVASSVPSAISVPIPSASGKKSWFGSPSSKSPPSPTAPSPLAGTSLLMPSSIDEEVPHLSKPNSKSTAQPSPARPLWRQPKVPLEKALASAKAADIRDTHIHEDRAPGDTHEPIPQPQSDNSTTVADPATSEAPLESPASAELMPTSAETSSQYSSSWWSYVGWGPNHPPAEPPAATSADDSATHSANVAPILEHPASPVTPEQHPEISAPPAEPTPPSHSEEAAQPQYSSWFSPWSWYSTTSATGQPEPQIESAEIGAKAASEVVQEEALAREEAAPFAAACAFPATREPPNPIEATIATNQLGWASFFSSRMLLAKMITSGEHEAEKDENGMEVMDLDEDEGGGDKDKDRTVIAANAPSTMENGRQVANKKQQQQSGQKPLRSPSSGGRPGIKKSDPTPPPRNLSSKTEPPRVSTRNSHSPTPSKSSGRSSPTGTHPSQPNLVLPTWADTFNSPPRSTLPPAPTSTLKKTMNFVSGVLFAKDEGRDSERGHGKGKGKERAREAFAHFGKALPRAWSVMEEGGLNEDVLRGCKRVVVIGIHGWFPGAVMRSMLGEPTGTSTKFVAMLCQALEDFQVRHGVELDKVTQIPLEGEGTIKKRVDKLYNSLTNNQEWMDDLHAADAIFVATHSQGSIVSTHLLDRLIQHKHIRTSRSADVLASASAALSSAGGGVVMPSPPQRVCCLALCGIHLGPLRYLSSSSLLQPYIQYFESTAARELFEFQNTESEVSKNYVKALRNVVDHGTKMVFTASLNDQVVPIYSGLFTAASHPLILRALYIDGDAYHSSDFLSNLLVLLLRILNSGLSDSGLLVHLSEATAGSLNGVGHSTAYEELSTFALAVDYLFLTNHGLEEHPELVVQPFNANAEQNDYEIPWALRDMIADEHVAHFFSKDFSELRNAFPHWHPKTTILRDIKRKLQPITRMNSFAGSSPGSVSKL
ncbi:hypothetical protein EW146_g5041 [Bondarzewia mesenterica]|uniref:YMC020W-like alpha/beta hydrolase domain-containing protein n=1 Tax=Bondarzewia mesenterica TaxID=1095465 RepID=A0A4S4LUI5_9AGAM|nr:hypothetical protein EW146_g5041 [Bondarzewia mesenterica]